MSSTLPTPERHWLKISDPESEAPYFPVTADVRALLSADTLLDPMAEKLMSAGTSVRMLVPGQQVSIRAEAVNQDGFAYRAVTVWTDDTEPSDRDGPRVARPATRAD